MFGLDVKKMLFTAALAATMLLGACGTDDPAEKGVTSCTQHNDCDPGFYCSEDNKCSQDCDPSSSDAQCAEGLSCDSLGRCVTTGECQVDDDCDSPPSGPTCEEDVLFGFSETGSCDVEDGENVCNYTESRTTCENGCSNGNCLEDPCETLVCDSPPADTCDADGVTLVSYSTPGNCAQGECQYSEMRMTCALGCLNGACVEGPCDGVNCDMGMSECQDNMALTRAQNGTCVENDEGAPICQYDVEFEHCSYTGATCDDATVSCVNPVPQNGGVVIVEVMADPVGSFNDFAEWFEIQNVSGAEVNLNGWTIVSSGNSGDEEHEIAQDLTFADGDRLVLCRTDTAEVPCDLDYASVILSNSTDRLELHRPDGTGGHELVDYLFWEPGSVLDGRSRKFDPDVTATVTANDDFSNWCPSMGDEFATNPSNYGTPGAANTACLADPCQQFSCEPPQGFCLDGENKAVQYVDNNTMCEISRFNNPFCDFETTEVECQDGAELCAFGICETIPNNVPEPGELIFSEIMANPSGRDSDREWFELYNTTGQELSLFSVIFQDNEQGGSADSYQFMDINATVAAGEYVVFARVVDSDTNGGVSGAIQYSGQHLKNTPGADFEISINQSDGTTIDAPFYGNISDGESLQLDPDALDATSNDDAANWCAGMTEYGAGGDGTPGAANQQCPQ